MPSWLNMGKDKDDKKDDKDDKKDGEIELKPSEVKSKLDQIDSVRTSVEEMKKTSDRMNSFLDQQDEAKRRATAEAAAKKASESSVEIDEEWITDPKKAFEKSVDPLVKATIRTNSRLARKEIFDENPAEFEFYTGEFKDLVDGYIDRLPLNSQNDAASIKNCYFLVYGMKQKEIKDGKIKSKFSSTSSATGRDGKTQDEKKIITLTDAEKKAAKVFGLSEDDYAKSKEDLSYV